jgi:ABC-type antimicrobial peptide transport system permease subunit
VREGKVEQNFQAFLTQLKNIPGVEKASYMYGDLTGGASSRSGGLYWEGKNPQEVIPFSYLDIDYELIETLGLQLNKGRSFSKNYGSDSSAIIFNEAAIKMMGIKDPIGKKVDFYGKRQIIGIVKNFHFESLHEKVKPFFFKMDEEAEGNILVRIKAGTEKATLTQIQTLYKKFNPGFPFDYKFLNESYQAQYIAEQRISILSKYFAVVAILLSCLGLFGLAAFTIERKQKEIGIRKVLGASNFNILNVLSFEFNKLVLVSILFALPISYLIVKSWLNGFAFRIDLSPWYFIIAAVLAMVLAWLTVGMQAIKAAIENPVKSLRSEYVM